MEFNENDIALIRELQKDVFLEADPFQRISDALGRPLDNVLEQIKDLKTKGIIRRFGAALTPANAGFAANAMVVWDVAGKDEYGIGELMASHPRISHCYRRPPFGNFPYTLYTMMHANSDAELQDIIHELCNANGLSSFRILKTVKELKKTSPVYFG